ncbi:A-kinase anchor 12-like protein [Labeo rohita]|uniref:A-kinase anchor 12-like protein n=1 Tax=Labeo rohita TaxID=84645 RepID=A0A498NPQ0_LABRO|nr:A-kinase anchor 12-like protein [Labeo rohita]
MGATTSSVQRDSRCEEDAAAEELTAAASDARDDGSADDKVLQKNGQISSLNVKTRSHADELSGNLEERVLADVGSGFVTLQEDGTETIEDLQEMDALEPVTKNESTEMVNPDSVSVKEETVEDNQVNDINEVGFKKIFRFVGFKFTLKKDSCEKTEANEPEDKVASASDDSNYTQENCAVEANENTPVETVEQREVSSEPDAAEPSQQTDNEKELDQDIKIVEHHVEDTPEKELAKEESPEPEEPMSPIKQFFTQGIFASLRKKKKEEEIQKESKEEELKRIEKMAVEEAEKEDSKCMCLDIPYITSEEEKDSQEKDTDTLLPEGDLQNSLEKDKVQGSPLKRLFRKFSTRRQKAAEKVTESEERVSEQPKPSSELIALSKVEEPVVGEPKPAEEELVADVSPQESKKKSDTTVSWEALICGGSAKKRARKTNEEETPDKGEEYEKTTDSPLGSSIEGDYDHLTSSNEQTVSPAEGEVGSTWKTFKKMVTPKRKIRTGESGTPEQIPSDSEMNKDEPFSMKKLIPGHKKRKSEARKEQTSSDEATQETGDEDDETPAIIPLSEYEIIEPESLKEVNEQRVEITIEHEMPEMTSQVLEQDTSTNVVPKIAAKVPINTGPAVIHGLPEDFEELTEFLSKHQQLSDIPEEGIIEESIETPVSSAEWTTQDDTLAEDIVELTADAVTAPEPASEQFIGDDTTEMVSAVSQLTESPKSSGHVTPVSAEYGIQTSDVILQEAIQSIGMTPSVQSVTTKDESQESLAVSFSPYVVQSSTLEETKVLVAHKKTEATAICIGLVSQEIEPVEEHLPAPLVEAIPEVSDAVPTELVSDNFTDETEIAGLGTDEVYEAEIKEVKTEYQEVIVNEKESATETELREQVIQLEAEPLVKELEETYMEDKREECTTGIETTQSEAGLDQVMSDYTRGPETEYPLRSVLEEPVYEQPVAAEPEKELTLSDVELSAAEFEQPAPTESLTHGDVDTILDTTTSKEVKDSELIASTVECLETKETVSIVSPISDHIPAERLELEESLKLETDESIHVDVCETHVDVKDLGESGVTVEGISEKKEEKDYEIMAQQDVKEIHVEEEIGGAVASEVVNNTETENILEAGDESLAREELPAKEVSLPELVLVEEATEHNKEESDANLDNKLEDSATDRIDGIFVEEEEEHAVKEGQPLSNETQIEDVSAHTNTTDESPEISADTGREFGDTVSEFSKDVSEHIETPAEPEASSEVILKPLEMVLPEIEAKPVATETVVSQTEDWNQDSKPSPELPKENEEPATTENIKTGKVLEMVAIIENTTKQLIVSEQVTEVLPKSQLTTATEQEGEAIDGDQAPAKTSSEMKETAVPEEKDTMAVASKPEPDRLDSGPTMIEVPAITVQAQNYAATEIQDSKLSEQKNKAEKNAKLKCESLEQVTEKTLSNELQVDKTEIPAVMEIKPIAQVPPMSTEVTAEMPEVAVSEMQPQVVSELRAETFEVTEPKVEIPVVTDVKIETAVVTELEVETPVVTSVVSELEVETPVVTSMAKTTDTQNSAVTSQNQNIDTDRSGLATVIKEQVVEIPTVISVIVTPATSLDEVKPVVTLGNKSKDVPPVKDTPVVTVGVETPNVESVIVRTAVAQVVEIQNVIPVVAPPDLGSVIVTEAAFPVVSIAPVTTVVEATVVETPVFTITAVKSIPAMVEKTVVSPVVEIPATVTSAVETPAVVSVAETVPPEVVTLDGTPFAETSVSQISETPVVSITSVKPTVTAVAKTPVTEIPAMISVTVAEAVSPVVVTSTGIPVVVEVVTSTAETSPVTPVVETPAQISVIATDAAPPVTPAATAASAVIPVVQTPSQVSVIITEAAPPVVVSGVTAAVETPVVIPVVETPVVKSTPVAVVETPVVTPVVQTPGQVPIMVTEAAPPVVVSAETAAVGTPVEIPVVETPVVKSTPVAVDETPVTRTPGQIPVMVIETAPPVVVSAETAAVGAPVEIPVAETTGVKSTPVAVNETPVVQTPGQVPVMVTETCPRVVVSAETAAVGAPVEIPVAETTGVKSTPVAVNETPVVQTPCQVPVMVTETGPSVAVSAETAAVETPVEIPVVETHVVKSTPVAVVETPVVTPVVQTPVQFSVMVTETAPPADTSAKTAAVETSVVISVVETPVVKSTPVALVEAPVVTPVVQTSGQILMRVPGTVSPGVVSAETAAVETPVVKSTPVMVVESQVVTPLVQIPGEVPVMVTETEPPVVVSAAAATVETPVVIPVVESSVIKPAPLAVVETPVLTPVAQTPCQVLVAVAETAPPVVVSAVSTAAETPVMIPVVETPVVKSTAVAVIETPVVTSVVQTPGQVSEMVTETAPPVVVSAVAATVETPVVIPVVGSPVVKPAPLAVLETPVLTPVAQTPCQVLVAVTEAAPPVVVSAVTTAAETPVVIPVVENATPVVVAETPVVTPVMMTPTVTPIAERSVVSPVLEITAEAPTAIGMAERPVMIPVVQTPALVSVIAKETAPPVVLPAVTAGAVTSIVSPTVDIKPPVAMAETPVPGPEVPAVISAVQTPVAEQVAQTPTTPAVLLVKATSVVTGMEAPAVTTLEKARQETPVAETPPVAPPVVTPEVKQAMLQVVQEKKEAKAETSVTSKDVELPFVAVKEVKTSVLTEEYISDKENGNASLQHVPAVTTAEPQSEVEEDVWEDAVDNIGDSLCQVTHTEGSPQDAAAKQASDAAI